jgi:hypothetical protein
MRIAMVYLDDAAILDIGRDQDHVTAGTRVDITPVDDTADTATFKLEITLEKILVGNVQRRTVKTGGIDTGTGTDHQAVLVY